MINRKHVVGLLIFWAVVLIGFIGFKLIPLISGTAIYLKSAPVDPRDLFRGDYVVLNYEISRIHMDSVSHTGSSLKTGQNIYVKLEVIDGIGHATAISSTPFREGLFIKGKVKYNRSKLINIEYGIESYFVQKGTGKVIEKIVGEIDVLVSIDRRGNVGIKSLHHNGEEI
ncbi:MAG: GDYXXLXY domain-containing protein [Saprospiraceae bacterium]|nr:GDYXXLXY domain-containing protein [Saprospiraceae bacterium]